MSTLSISCYVVKKCNCCSFAVILCLLLSFAINKIYAEPEKTIVNRNQSCEIPNDTSETVDSMPAVLLFVNADYPDSLIAKGIEGEVAVDLLVNENGSVDSATIKKGIHPILDRAAVKALLHFKFSPAKVKGDPVAVMISYLYKYSITEQKQIKEKPINFKGLVYQKGTRTPLANAHVIIGFSDTAISVNKRSGEPRINVIQEGMPLAHYLKIIGTLPGQQYEDGQIVAQTDSLGQFSFSGIPSGSIDVKIISTGHRVFNKKINIKQDEISDVKFYVSNELYNDYEITVYGKSTNDEISHYAINGEEIRKIAGFSGEAVKAVQALPGVARPVEDGLEIIVRGSDNNDTRILYDGIEIPFLYHEATPIFLPRSIVNPDALSAVNFYPGGMGVRYGNVLGGVVDLSSRAARSDRIHASVDLNLKGISLFAETPIVKGLSAIGSFRGDLAKYTMNLVYDKILHTPLAHIEDNYDYSLRVDYVNLKSHRIFLESIGAKDTMHERVEWYDGDDTVKTDVTLGIGRKFYQGIAGWDWNINSSFKNELRLGLRTQWRSINKLHEVTYDLHDELTNKFSDKLILSGGVDIQVTSHNSSNAVSEDEITWVDKKDKRAFGRCGFYGIAAWNPVERLSLTSGLRYDFYPQLDYNGAMIPEYWNYKFKNTTRFSGDPSLRFSVQYAIDKKQSLFGSVGTYSQSPDSMILEYKTNKNVVSEKGSQFTVGYKRVISDLLSLDVQAYYNFQWDICRDVPYHEQKGKYESGEKTELWSSDGKARMKGLEIMLRRDMGRRFFGWLAYSLSQSERYSYYEKKWIVYDYNILNNVQLVGQWVLRKNHSLGFRFQYTDGHPYTPKILKYYDATSGKYYAEDGETNSGKYTPYIGLDINYSKKIVLKKSIITPYIELLRLVHILELISKKDGKPFYQATEGHTYNYDFSDFEGIANFPMINFGAKWEF
jgi:TonB family protein